MVLLNNEEKTFSWDECKAITNYLLEHMANPDEENIAKMVSEPGICAMSYEGNELGFGLWSPQVKKIVYVGATRPSADRHFTDGQTGYSTLRRSLGALLQSKYDLKPIPRSQDESDNDRFSNFAFDEEGEAKLTKWMKDNLKIAFWATPPEQAETLKFALIEYNVPIFNLQKNPENKYGAEIKMWRRKCSNMAQENNYPD